MEQLQSPLTKGQLEMLKIMARPMSDDDLIAIKNFVVHHFAKKLTERANKVWNENNWTEEDEKRMLTMNARTPVPEYDRFEHCRI